MFPWHLRTSHSHAEGHVAGALLCRTPFAGSNVERTQQYIRRGVCSRRRGLFGLPCVCFVRKDLGKSRARRTEPAARWQHTTFDENVCMKRLADPNHVCVKAVTIYSNIRLGCRT
jgi:hypothetical protein